MEDTPRTRSRFRPPTPRLSERKKKLFGDVADRSMSPYVRLERIIIEEAEEAEDSDIGPMSPLEFSSSPSSFHDVHRIIARDQNGNAKTRRTNFSNIMAEISIANSNSPRTRSRTKQSIVTDNSNDNVEAKDSSEDDVVGPLCTSMKKLSSMTEQNYEQQLKTPSEMTMSSKSSSDQLVRGASFRKSLVFDTGLTPHDDESNASNVMKSQCDEPPKAKTSLTFGEPVISVRSFYGKPVDKPVEPKHQEIDLVAKLNSHEFAAAIAKRTAQLKPKSKTKSKSSLAKRMKVPSLWRFSGKMKFNRHKRLRPLQKVAKKKKLNTSTNSNANDEKRSAANDDAENVPPNGSEFTSRIEQNLRLQKILKEQTNALGASRDINWNGSAKKSTVSNIKHVGFANSDGEDDDGSDNENPLAHNFTTYEEVEVEIEEPTNRKFFKSSASNSAKKYRIMGRLSATMKRGGDLKFDPMPKRRKKRPNKDGETVILHNEITSIIDRLTSPRKVKHSIDADSDSEEIVEKPIEEVTEAFEPNHSASDFIEKMQTENTTTMDTIAFEVNVEQYRQMIPYNTTDPEKISQQESILELLISNGICDAETFKIFIAEPDLHKERASQILDSLYCVNTMMPVEYENDGTIEWINSVETVSTPNPSMIVPVESMSNDPDETFPIVVADETASQEISDTVSATLTASVADIINDQPTTDAQTEKLFPIFQKNFTVKDNTAPTFNAINKAPKEWTPIGSQQYQLDVGQKEFGIRTCAQCEMQYSVHEPEDELLHLKYHNCVNILSFKGWNNERIVTQINDWGLYGRIIYICEADSKAKKDRVKEVIDMVDRDLGFAARTELKPKTLVYFAIAKQQIVGVCVVQPLERAHRFKTENGVDCYTIETYPVKCGISRVWVAPQYRRHGIAAKLITSMRGHFLFGAFLSFDEIAFSSPTEDGKKFATKLTQRSDFLIYEH